MKFAERPAIERTAIDAWIRVTIFAREKECLDVGDDFKQVREELISEAPEHLPTMLRCYEAYQAGGHQISYTKYFSRANPAEYKALMARERLLEH